jgi:hypothetical protein
MGPDDERALELGRLIMRAAVLLRLGAPTPAMYTQDRLPPGVTRGSYLRRHGARVSDGAEGWTRVGKARVVTAAAWDADVAHETAGARARPRLAVVAPVPSIGDSIDARLGIRTRRATR